MDFESVKMWLTHWTERQAAACRWKGILGLVLLPIALAAGGALIFFILWITLHDKSHNPGNPKTCLWITLAILPCLFIINRFIARRDLMEERMREGTADSLAGTLIERRVTVLLFLMWIVFTGPRVLDWALGSFRQARRVKQMDVHSCTAVLWLLLSRGKKVSFDDIRREFDWLNLDTILPELRGIEGVVPLQHPPPGLSLTQELRDEIQRAPA